MTADTVPVHLYFFFTDGYLGLLVKALASVSNKFTWLADQAFALIHWYARFAA
jgi:hypothetical protein